jgi:hypothetical protein
VSPAAAARTSPDSARVQWLLTAPPEAIGGGFELELKTRFMLQAWPRARDEGSDGARVRS